MKIGFIFIAVVLGLAMACSEKSQDQEEVSPLFELLDRSVTGIDFENTLRFDQDFNIYTYRNFYNGGGVAIGDIDRDGLPDIYFTSNMGSNRLYRNMGGFRFEDITAKAGVGGNRSWSTGVTMVDINADGWLDIYVCNSGDVAGDDKQNELFINKGDGSFSERAEAFGLADQGLSTHAAFFDYDRDGDLDAYVLNNSFRAIGSFNLKENERGARDSLNGDRFYINQDGVFEDKSEQVGIYGSTIGFGLGVMVSDLDLDGWQDVYVCNDFFERDYVYMNNRDGTFREGLTDQMQSIGMASMGVDATDLNHDGYPELFVTEMLPKDEARLKTTMSFENWNKYQYNLKHDYYNQFTRNMLQVNNGPIKDGKITFSEQGRISGVEATDWSWSALFADWDLDGYSDLYITNGIYQDILNQDYLRYISNESVIRSMVTDKGVDYNKLIEIIPSNPISNVAYCGGEGLTFEDNTASWGLQIPGFSNGAAYGDLDNDGDLDLVVNNVNMKSFVYKNRLDERKAAPHYLKVTLAGSDSNSFAIGANVSLFQKGERYTMQQMPTRGFQSSMDYSLHFGLKTQDNVDSLWVQWPSGNTTRLLDIGINTTLAIREQESESGNNGKTLSGDKGSTSFQFEDFTALIPEEMKHSENSFSDFDSEGMVFQMHSTEGPKMAVGDVNGDGLDDVFLCGAVGDVGKLFLQQVDGRLSLQPIGAFGSDRLSEDVDALFFDADSDGDLDLYVASGGTEYPEGSPTLADRLYRNDGQGRFAKITQSLQDDTMESTSCIAAADFDNDGDQDLFIGVRMRKSAYGVPQNGYILENDGRGNFRNRTNDLAPGLKRMGLIRDGLWTDFDRDGKKDLIVVGEWMPIQIFRNTGQIFENVTEAMGIDQYSGWWNTIVEADLDNDGDKDYIIGNHGLNSRFRATMEKPVSCYISDFDGNGRIEQIICTYNGDASYPLVLRHDLTQQLPYLNKQFLQYEDYKLKKIEDIMTQGQLARSEYRKVTFLETAVMWNEGKSFRIEALPRDAQVAPVYAIHIQDFDLDGYKDILLAGNLFEVKPEIGRYDASYGSLLRNNGKHGFEPVPNRTVGLKLTGQSRDIAPMFLDSKMTLLIAKNNEKVQAIRVQKESSQ